MALYLKTYHWPHIKCMYWCYQNQVLRQINSYYICCDNTSKFLMLVSLIVNEKRPKLYVYTYLRTHTASFGHILNACDGAVSQFLCSINSYYICCGNSSEFLMLVGGLPLKWKIPKTKNCI